ncbi:MAG: FKBP-type peptidyl-prolyl cis-trans isomerase [Sphingomonadales bacterium]|nr:FKBP-type peptidyl-prolyl cis-trans isomerase [Sphingomonadales bacterium]
MKKWILSSLALTTAFAVLAQTGPAKKVVAPVKKPATATSTAKPATPAATKPAAAAAMAMVTDLDSVSYALGISLASYYKTQGVTQLNTTLLARAVSDFLQGKPTLIDNSASSTILNNYMTRLQNEKSKFNKQEGELFLAANKKRAEVTTTESGLQYEVLVQGTGEQPTAADTVTCHYRGTFLDGKGFDNSYDRGQPISFPLTGVIRGWTEGLQLMKTGSKYRFYIPYTLGYGEYDYMSIPGGSLLVFEVELIDIKRKK